MLTLGSVLAFADAVLFLLALFNIVGLYLLAGVVKQEVAEYRRKRETGEVTRIAKVR